MSRCFPYPPPGYYPKGERNEALIESSIKLQKEREKAKTERKEERNREKKERKRESKVKDGSEFGHGEKRKRKRKDEKAHKGGKDEKTHKEGKDGFYDEGKLIQKRGEDEAEQLERSNLTEEHGPPVSLQNPCYSSDSTENSNKRRRQTSPMNEIRRTHGNILRIRLPSLKLKEPDASVNEEKLYSSSKPIQEEFRSTETDVCRRDEEQICSTSGGTGDSAQVELGTATVSTSKKEIPTVESLFKDLVENWVSPPIQSERADLDELDWLFGQKRPGREIVKASRTCTGSADLLPRAQYLPEADIFALPFTVPF